MVSLQILQDGEIEKTETKEKQARLPDKKEVLDFCLEKQPVKRFRKKEDENPQEHTMQPNK